jgi:hypothetical protein
MPSSGRTSTTVHTCRSPSQHVRTSPPESRPVAVLSCCTSQPRQVHVSNYRMTRQNHSGNTAPISLRASPLWNKTTKYGYEATSVRCRIREARCSSGLMLSARLWSSASTAKIRAYQLRPRGRSSLPGSTGTASRLAGNGHVRRQVRARESVMTGMQPDGVPAASVWASACRPAGAPACRPGRFRGALVT